MANQSRDLRRVVGSLGAAIGVRPGREVAAEVLGREGWLHLSVEAEGPSTRSRFHIALDFRVQVALSRPGIEGLYVHPFTLTLSYQGCVVEEWSDALSSFWRTHAAPLEPGALEGTRLEIAGRLPLLDVDVPSASTFEIHLRLPWRDAEKREGFELSSHLESAVLRVYSQGPLRRMVCEPGFEQVIIG